MDQLESLRIFTEIIEMGSLSAVARARAISPSTVTLTLQELEEQLGVQLITRTTRQLSLTPEGERFLADCRRILADLDEAMERVAERGAFSGLIRVTATNDFGRNRLTELIDRFMAEHPEVQIELLLTDAVIDLVDEGFDVGIRTGPLQDSRLQMRLLVRGTRKVCAAPAYWERSGRPAHPDELERHNCLVLARPGAPQQNWHFQEAGDQFSVRVSGNRTTNDGGALRRWACSGAGVVLKAGWDIEADVQSGRLETVLEEFTAEEINLYAVYPTGRRLSRRVSAFVDFLVEQLRV